MDSDSAQTDIRLLEELALNAWPALRTVCLDGWLLRFSSGYTRRSNSIQPLWEASLPLSVEQRIEHCERLYALQQLPARFKICPASRPEKLDAVLESRGYRAEAESIVQTAAIHGLEPHEEEGMTGLSRPSDGWLQARARLNGIAESDQAAVQKMFEQIVPEARFMELRQDGEPAALGLGVVERGHLGLFDIVTATHFRNRGLGRRLVRALLAWGASRGAERAYLQVLADNAPALNLYRTLGFSDVYRYHYRFRQL